MVVVVTGNMLISLSFASSLTHLGWKEEETCITLAGKCRDRKGRRREIRVARQEQLCSYEQNRKREREAAGREVRIEKKKRRGGTSQSGSSGTKTPVWLFFRFQV